MFLSLPLIEGEINEAAASVVAEREKSFIHVAIHRQTHHDRRFGFVQLSEKKKFWKKGYKKAILVGYTVRGVFESMMEVERSTHGNS